MNENSIGFPQQSCQSLGEVTGQLHGDAGAIDKAGCSTDDELFAEVASSASEYIPDSDESISILVDPEMQHEEILDEETGQLLRKEQSNGRTKKRQRKGHADKFKWKRIKNAEARMKGQEYVGFKKTEVKKKYEQTVVRPAKKIEERCDGHTKHANLKHGGPKQNFECKDLTEADRQSIFQYYWNLPNWETRKVYIRTLVTESTPPHRRRTDGRSRKVKAFKYFLTYQKDDAVKRVHVCKAMFMNTLSIRKRQLRDWLIYDNDNEGHDPDKETPIDGSSNSIIEFFDSLPKMESHYCRASSTKLYLEPIWNSVSGDLYEEYTKFCKTNKKKRYCNASFQNMFRKLNLSIFTPRKDQCNKCMAFKNGNLAQEEYNTHIMKKEQSREEKDRDKNESDEGTLVYTMDVQAVLLCPRIQASATYYKTKLKVHNYTHYNLKTKEVICYLWHEGNGGLDSDVFASIMVKHLKSEIHQTQCKKIILWSDGCGYQNRSINLANALLELAVENQILIEQKYLEVGHTQMEVDSIHSSIERKLPPHREIFVPADYINVIKSARRDPEPYKVVFLCYDDFKKCEGGRYTSIRPGNKKGDPLVVDIVALRYHPEGKIQFKTQLSQEYQELPRRPNANRTHHDEEPLYQSPLPIELTKFNHLQEMKPLIPRDYHPFYDSLEHNCSNPICPHIRNN